ncbi:hypothetical protein H6G80_03975 [Nostoc sp. FACHB-87]|uniref:hypothetical protein n=1 Tax=Nostocaceae TaxID=1162 RepID=UPI0016852F05|nr:MULTISPECIES: hypothetical protein [Nostocaceae]MBD2298939.1 hypothetical protein [Nostoc sp. FACHB-190]MBD2453233.1 hypothetical protein [Nostoc sp. FACHB-87]MBD2474987.1 hypothetical protein [Anabaena sp. FACHB-83]
MNFHVDPILSFIVETVEESKNIEFPLTIFTKGIIVTGLVIPMEKFFDNTIQKFVMGTGDLSARELLIDVFKQTSITILDISEEERKERGFLTHTYIHLKNVKIISNGTTYSISNENCWRVKLDEVDGFTIGIFGD